jgi:hypothetical protein
VFGNRAIANVALQSQFGQARFHGAFFGSALPWWRGGLVLGWFGPLFWPYAYYDLFDYAYWPYAYDDFWPYAYDDVYYGIYGPYYAYGGSYAYRPYADPNGHYTGRRARHGASSGRYAARANGSERPAAEVCSDDVAQLTDWPIERISEVVQPSCASFGARRTASRKRQSHRHAQGRLSQRPAQHPHRTAWGDGEPAAGHACGRTDGAPGPRALLPVA